MKRGRDLMAIGKCVSWTETRCRI